MQEQLCVQEAQYMQQRWIVSPHHWISIQVWDQMPEESIQPVLAVWTAHQQVHCTI